MAAAWVEAAAVVVEVVGRVQGVGLGFLPAAPGGGEAHSVFSKVEENLLVKEPGDAQNEVLVP